MSNKNSPTERLWHGSLLVLGSVIILSIVTQWLTSNWGWLVVAGVAVALIGLTRLWLHSRRSGW
jgi:hypothetical protein